MSAPIAVFLGVLASYAYIRTRQLSDPDNQTIPQQEATERAIARAGGIQPSGYPNLYHHIENAWDESSPNGPRWEYAPPKILRSVAMEEWKTLDLKDEEFMGPIRRKEMAADPLDTDLPLLAHGGTNRLPKQQPVDNVYFWSISTES